MLSTSRETCEKPAVDFVFRTSEDGETYKFWLCAEHFDLLQRMRKIIREHMDEDRDYKFRSPTPGKG